ncbi:MAG: SMP-30/gluconolactonase/LRE family protein [Clostridia bacterium]|nr:SMP-30/gluconolactonase/LRE family protein [Clostridia bacterium]
MSRNVLQKVVRLCAVCLVLVLALSMAVSADMTLELTYTYNSYSQAVPVPDLFQPIRFVGGEDVGCETFSKPGEMHMTADGYLYVCDTNNNRIVVLDANKDLKLVSVMEEFYDTELQEATYLFEPAGVFVDDDGAIYISDTLNNRIIRCDAQGNIDRTYYTPEIHQFNDEVPFEPTRLLVDQQDNVYALCRGIYHGMVLFNADGEYETFYGAESVYASAEVRMAQWWKSIMSEEAEEGTAQYVPTEMKCIDIDDDGYIYSIAQSHSTLGTKNEMDSIRKLNAKGMDILVNKMPKLSAAAFKGAAVRLNMTDLTVDDDGYITIVETTTGKLLHFDKEMNLLGMSGSIGYDLGQFQVPSAVEQYGDRIYVMDQSTNKITVMELSEFGESVHKAVSAYHEGYYDQTVEPWNEVISLSANYEFAYTCLGNAYLNKGDYKQALTCFELGRDSTGYNEAYKQLRQIAIREVLIYVIVAILVLVVALAIIRKIVKAIKIKKSKVRR